ncbi:hypothetical protein [Streptomyces sp. NPDC127098]|uniref:hypothetical protein n=1 Tax=Streptomyces sp. NPDC127098 TaxID=3347137 RepID=UPI003659D427
MPNGDLIHFRSENLETIQTQTTGQQERYIGIWDNVRTQLLGLIEAGQVDAQVGGVLEERDQIFRREATGFDDSVIAQNTAVRNVQNIGVEGGAAMVRAARGGA